jgi:hypothetical protein
MTDARRSMRRNAAILIVAVVVVVFVAWTVVAWILMIHSVYPWDWAYWTGREVIRTIWAALTGEPVSRDLFPW